MKRVKVYKPKIRTGMKGKRRFVEIEDKKHELIRERGVMDRTLEQYQENEFNTIIQSGLYMEEVKAKKEVKEEPKRTRRTKEQIEEDNQKTK